MLRERCVRDERPDGAYHPSAAVDSSACVCAAERTGRSTLIGMSGRPASRRWGRRADGASRVVTPIPGSGSACEHNASLDGNRHRGSGAGSSPRQGPATWYRATGVGRGRMLAMTGWPPTGPPRPDDWWSPELWTPKGYPVAIGMGFMGHPTTMAAIWCRATLSEAHRYYQAALRADWTNWAIERGEDWSPSEAGLRRSIEELWIRGCQLVMAADQAQSWVRRANPETAQIRNLRTVRNVIAHLEGAAFDEDFTIATADHDGRNAWSLDEMPEGQLIMGLAAGSPTERVFGAVILDDILVLAREHADDDEPELD